MDRIHHVHVPAGWTLGAAPPEVDGERPGARDSLNWDEVFRVRAASETGGFMVGDQTSRQFQVLSGQRSHLWSVAIASRDLEGARQRCIERSIPVTEPRLFEFEDQAVRAFSARVGGLLFEVMRVEPAGQGR